MGENFRKKGGFTSVEEEEQMKERGRKMIRYVQENPGPLTKKTITIESGNMPPHFYLSEEDNIILCGLVDWLEYIPETDSVKIVDFKTGKNEEEADSLQLPIYLLLVSKLQKRKVTGASYWYLDESIEDNIVEKDLPTYEEAFERVLQQARKVKEARELGLFECPHGEGGCFACQPYEKIVRGEAECVGKNEINQDVYIINA